MDDIVNTLNNSFISSVWKRLPLPWDFRDQSEHTAEEKAEYRAICESRWRMYCEEANKRFPDRKFDSNNPIDASRAFALILNPKAGC
jgi:hypothetical protein